MSTQHLQYPGAVKKLFIAYLVLIANTGYLMAFSHENWFYAANVVLHFLLGAAVILPFLKWARLFLRHDAHHGKPFGRNAGRMGYAFMILAAFTGLALAFESLFQTRAWLVVTHATLGILACLFMISSIRRAGYNISVDNIYSRAGRWGLVVFISSGVFVLIAHGLRSVFPNRNHVIENSVVMPVNLEEGAMGGADGPFYPSPLETDNENYLNHDFLLNSQSCGTAGCHPDIVKQWQASGHSRASLNNEHYRAALRFLEKRADDKTRKFCAGCHSPALLVSGLIAESVDDLVKQNLDDPGVGCNACHAVKRVKSTAGNADMRLKRPGLTSLGMGTVGWQRKLYEWIINAAPDMHQSSMLQPFHREQSSEFCSTCHEISLEAPILEEGWASGPNHYDSWRMSSFGGSPVLSFFDDGKRQDCVDCHMPLVPSRDAGNRDGFVRDHRFLRFAGLKSIPEKPIAELFAFVRPAMGNGSSINAVPARAIAAPPSDFTDKVKTPSTILDVVIKPSGVGHFLPFGAYETRQFGLAVELIEPVSGKTISRQWIDALNPAGVSEETLRPRLAFRSSKEDSASALRALEVIPADAARLARLTVALPTDQSEYWIKLQLVQRNRALRHNPNDGHAKGQDAVLSETMLELVQQEGGWQVRLPEDATIRARIWNQYGAALFFEQAYAQARQAFRQAVKAQPNEPLYRVNLARTWLAIGQTDSAKVLLATVLKQDKRHPRANFFLSQCFKLEKDYQRAMKYLRRARRKYREDVTIMLAEGELYYLMQAYKKAIRVLRRVILRHPENALAHYYRMLANRKLGRFDKAAYETELYHKFAVRKLERQPLLSFNEPGLGLPPIFQHFVLPEKDERGWSAR